MPRAVGAGLHGRMDEIVTNHFTNKVGYDGIRSQREWRFRAAQPPGEHERGAYFTTLDASAPRLAARLGIPREKLAYLFAFTGQVGLEPMNGGRGSYILFSRLDYLVAPERQAGHGPTGLT